MTDKEPIYIDDLYKHDKCPKCGGKIVEGPDYIECADCHGWCAI